ncbi:MAG: hypothetical protein SGILL_007517, partial [Bacillariaceae sp.]
MVGTYDGSDKVVIKIEEGSKSYYIGYNRAVGMNSQTKEGGNRVTIVKKTTVGYQTTNLEATLSTGSTYTINDFRGSGEDVRIKFAASSHNTDKAIVEITYTGNPVTPFPTAAPTEPCQQGESFFELTVQCDYWCPEDNSFKLIHQATGSTVLSGGSLGRYAEDYRSVCLNRDTEYAFHFEDVYGDGMPAGNNNPAGSARATVDGNEVFKGWGDEQFKEKVETFKTPGGGS